MKKQNIKIGGYYWANVSDRRVIVKIISTSVYGGWDAVNTVTGREIRIRTAQRLLKPAIKSE